MGARVLIPQADGSNARGAFMTVSRGNVYNGGVVLITQSDGAISPVTTLANIAPQQPNFANFQGRTGTVAVASLSYSGTGSR